MVSLERQLERHLGEEEAFDGESQANILLDKRPRGESKVSGGVFQGAPAGSQFQHRVEAGKD